MKISLLLNTSETTID